MCVSTVIPSMQSFCLLTTFFLHTSVGGNYTFKDKSFLEKLDKKTDDPSYKLTGQQNRDWCLFSGPFVISLVLVRPNKVLKKAATQFQVVRRFLQNVTDTDLENPWGLERRHTAQASDWEKYEMPDSYTKMPSHFYSQTFSPTCMCTPHNKTPSLHVSCRFSKISHD